jgi:hypothetical protein
MIERSIIAGIALILLGLLMFVVKNKMINDYVVMTIISFVLFLGFTTIIETIINLVKYFYK